MAMMIEHLFQYSGQEEFCAVLGYFNQLIYVLYHKIQTAAELGLNQLDLISLGS